MSILDGPTPPSSPKRIIGTSYTPPPKRRRIEPTIESSLKKSSSSITAAKREVVCKANWEINEELIRSFKKHEEARAVDRVLLIPDVNETNHWLAFHPDNPTVKFAPHGSYVYVTHCKDKINPEHPQGKKIAAWPVASTRVHKAKFHMGLSGFEQFLAYAGEVHFSETGKLEFFDNSSGTYRPKAENKSQAGFDPTKFIKPTFAF